MRNAVIKATGYVLAHAPSMVIHNGTTQTTERIINKDSEYLQKLPDHLRTYADVLAYAPHQTFIGNITPDELKSIPQPWYMAAAPVCERNGRFGEIMPELEFIALMQTVDTFELIKLTDAFAAAAAEALRAHPLLSDRADKIKSGGSQADIEHLITEAHAEALYADGVLVGCVKRAHDIDPNLSAHVMLENLASKASAVLALVHMAAKNGMDLREVEYVIECSEEACGDMNQRGGGNFAKSVAEAAGAVNATGSDTRGFCAAPVHALVEAASLVKAGTFRSVVIVAGGATAKLGMNGKDHVKKGIPILEDVLGGFAALVTADDGSSPFINTDCVGRHTVGTGSAPQAVISSLSALPLERAGLRITEVDKFAAELQNPDITKPAGAGDVPEANYKMIAALAVMRKEMERTEIPAFIEKHGMPGFAPTQGHIPSGIPYLGFAREGLTAGSLNKVMIIGKGSLFLGRMTNLFDGVSVLLERNNGATDSIVNPTETETHHARKVYRIGLTIDGSEHGAVELIEGARLAIKQHEDVTVVLIGGEEAKESQITSVMRRIPADRIEWVKASERDAHTVMESLLDKKQIDACVTMHYSFPIGVSTVGRADTPGRGRAMLIATTTGATATDRVEAMIKNAVIGIAAAKAQGITQPTVGVLNIDGAAKTENALRKLQTNGYDICFSDSTRADGGVLMRGNDLLCGAADVMVTDTLTGNLIMKMLSSYTTGGSYESVGSGYGPGLGEGYNRLVCILSRASGAPVAANAIIYAAQMAKGGVLRQVSEEMAAARKAGLDEIIQALHQTGSPRHELSEKSPETPTPPREVVTEEIHGIDILQLEEAVQALLRAGIYAESGMGCTGPVALVSSANLERAKTLTEPFK